MSKPASFIVTRYRRTRIDGRCLLFRVGRNMFDLRAAWGTPWDQYHAPVYAKVQRIRFGVRLAVRVWRPYLRIDLQRLPRHLFHEAQP